VTIRINFLAGIAANRNELPHNAFVKQSVYDVLGKLVTELVNQNVTACRDEASWNASNYASGEYFYKLETESFTDMKKMILVK